MLSKIKRGLGMAVASCALAVAWGGDVRADAGAPFRTAEYAANWGLEAINAAEAYGRGLTGAGITIGVVDSGVDVYHPELAGRLVAQDGFVYEDTALAATLSGLLGYPWPLGAHGTHVAGIVAGNRDGRGTHGVAPGASVVSADVFSTLPWELVWEYPFLADIPMTNPMQVFPHAIDYAVAQGARIINGSYGVSAWGTHIVTPWTLADYKAYRRAVKAGTILVFAAGNDYTPGNLAANNPNLPALMPYIRPENRGSGVYYEWGGKNYDFSDLEGMMLAVVAVDKDKRIASFSNRCGVARNWCVAAPGVAIRSPVAPMALDVTYEEAVSGYGTWDGTSMAAPHVSGALALLMEAFPGLDPRSIVRILLTTTDDLGARGVDAIYGHGLINIGRATRGPTTFSDDWSMQVDAGGESLLRNPISGSGGLIKTGDGTLRLTANNTFTGATVVQAGVLLIDGRSVSPLRVNTGATVGGNGTLAAEATILGTLAPGASPGVLTVRGPLRLGTAATFRAEVDGLTAGYGAGHHDLVQVKGAGNTFRADGTLVPVLRGISGVGANTFTPKLGQRFVVVTADGGIRGQFDALTRPQGLPGALRLDALYGARSIALVATPRSYAQLKAHDLRQSVNTQAVGAAIDALRPAPGQAGSGAARGIAAALYDLDPASLPAALDLASGSIHAEVERGQLMARRDLTRTLLTPLPGAARQVGTARVWADASNGWASVEGHAGGSGASIERSQFTAGVTLPMGEATQVGLAFSYGNSDLAQQFTPATADVNHWQVGVYGTHALGDTTLSLSLAAGLDRADTTRPLDLLAAGDAEAATNGRGLAAGVEIVHALRFDGGGIIRPALSLMGEQVWRDGVRESGGGAWRLTTADGSGHRLTATAGVSGSQEVDLGGTVFTPTVSAGLGYDLSRDGLRADATLAGEGFTARAAEPGRFGVNFGLGAAARVEEGVSLGLSYGFEGRDDARAHTARASISLTW